MGIRVHKDIGYYLAKKNIKKLLVADYDEVIDDHYTLTPELIERVIVCIQEIAKKYPQIDTVYSTVQLQELVKENHICVDNFVSIIHSYDTLKGVMFKTPNLKSYGRFDDLIDYYEEVDKARFKLRLLKQTIYPDNYYVCLATPPLSAQSAKRFAERHYTRTPLAAGHLLMADELRTLMLSNNIRFDFTKPNLWAYPEQGEPKYFHPYVDVMTYAFALEIKLINPNIDYLDFIQMLEPAIVTHWG